MGCHLPIAASKTALLGIYLCGLMLAWAPWARAELFQSVTAANPASITKNASNGVTAWADQSGNAIHASTGSGSAIYPAANLFSAGNAGVSFGPPATSIQLVNTTNAGNLLNFAGAAATHSGFAILVSVRVDQLHMDWSDLLDVTSATSSGFGLRYSNTGLIQTYMGGVTVQRPGADRKATAGDSVVFAVNYDATTGVLKLGSVNLCL